MLRRCSPSPLAQPQKVNSRQCCARVDVDRDEHERANRRHWRGPKLTVEIKRPHPMCCVDRLFFSRNSAMRRSAARNAASSPRGAVLVVDMAHSRNGPKPLAPFARRREHLLHGRLFAVVCGVYANL